MLKKKKEPSERSTMIEPCTEKVVARSARPVSKDRMKQKVGRCKKNPRENQNNRKRISRENFHRAREENRETNLPSVLRYRGVRARPRKQVIFVP